MGPPMAPLPQGQYAVIGGYAFSDMSLEVSGPHHSGVNNNASVINDIQTNAYYGGLVYGITEGWNI